MQKGKHTSELPAGLGTPQACQSIGVSSVKKHEVYVVSAKVLETRGTGYGVGSELR